MANDSPKPIGIRRALLGPRTVTLHIKVAIETADYYSALAHRVDSSRNDVCATVLEMRAHGPAVVRRIKEAYLEIVGNEYPRSGNNVDDRK